MFACTEPVVGDRRGRGRPAPLQYHVCGIAAPDVEPRLTQMKHFLEANHRFVCSPFETDEEWLHLILPSLIDI